MKLSFPFKSFLIYLGCTLADFLSSFGKWPAGFYEANPYARHLDGSFWPLHAAGNCLLDTGEILVLCAGAYFIVSYFHKKAALFAAGLPLLWYAYGHFDAAVSNLQTKLFFVPHANPDAIFEMIRQLSRIF